MSAAATDTASDFDPAAAAARLADAWRSGVQLAELPAPMRPRTLAEGYALQDALIEATGESAAGWKLGVGSPLALRQTGLGRPLVGRLLASHCHRSGARVVVPGGAPITIEFEIGFVLARDVASSDEVSSPFDVVAQTCVTFELLRSRFVDRRAVGWPSFAGDSVGFEALVIGDAIDPAQIDRITREVIVQVDGRGVARGLHGDELTDPRASLAALLAHARERGITLRRGEIVSTGAAARAFDIDGSADVVAHWPGGELRARVVYRD